MLSVLDLDPLELVGTWELSRVIIDHRADERSDVLGTSELTLQADARIRWTESGTLHRRGTDVAVSRVLYLEPREPGWFVTFEDGRDFHPWEPGSPVEHACTPDMYVGLVAPMGDDRWSVEWRVNGPGKDYTMTSVLTRSRPAG